ncbi:MAG: RusA family crossover junction endodeoxyribonuclease [Deinococcota bacterium]
MIFSTLIPKRPVSLQAKRPSLRVWKNYIAGIARADWSGEVHENIDMHLKLVYLYDDGTPSVDVDNIIKPIQDALVGIVYKDDVWITDVEAHKRPLTGNYDLTQEPYVTLLDSINNAQECVYLELRRALDLEDYWS